MNWLVFGIIILLAAIVAIMEYCRQKDFKAVVILVVGFAISILSGLLFPSKLEDNTVIANDIEEYQKYCDDKRELINNALCNREFDLGLDYLKELADTTKNIYGENSLELSSLYAEIGEFYEYVDNTVNAQKYIGYAKNIVSNYTPDKNNYISIAGIYKSCGDTEEDYEKSIYYYNRAIDIMAQFNDTAGELNANIYANLSDKYIKGNNYVDALKCAEKAEQLYELYSGTTSRGAGIAYCSLGNIYSYRNHDKALYYYQKAEQVFENNAPYDDGFLAICYSGMANLYSDIDQIKCYEYAQSALNLNQSIFGVLHKQTINSEINMATFYRVNGDLLQAKSLLEEALIKAEKKYGSQSKIAMDIFIELGNVTNTLYECINFYNKAEKIAKELFGETNIYIAYIYANKAVTYYIFDDLVKTKEFYNKAEIIYKEKTGSLSPELAYLYMFRGDIYYDENDYILSLYKFDEAKQIYDLLYGETNINSAMCCYKMARIYSINNEQDLAEKLFEQAIEIYEMTYGEYGFQNADIYYEYAKHLYSYKNDINMVIKYVQKAVDLASVSKMENSFSQARYSFSLGSLYFEIDNIDKGIDYMKNSISIMEYNELNIPLYIEALSLLAQQYSLIDGEYSDTIQYVDKTISVANEMGGHEDLYSAYYLTAIALGNVGEYERALEYLDIAEHEGLWVYDENGDKINLIHQYRDMILGVYNQ